MGYFDFFGFGGFVPMIEAYGFISGLRLFCLFGVRYEFFALGYFDVLAFGGFAFQYLYPSSRSD